MTSEAAATWSLDETTRESLAVNEHGCCIRHPNVTVVLPNEWNVNVCKICASENNAQVQQRRSMAFVIQQVQAIHKTPEFQEYKKNQYYNGVPEEEELQEQPDASDSRLQQQDNHQEPTFQQLTASLIERVEQVQEWKVQEKDKEIAEIRRKLADAKRDFLKDLDKRQENHQRQLAEKDAYYAQQQHLAPSNVDVSQELENLKERVQELLKQKEAHQTQLNQKDAEIAALKAKVTEQAKTIEEDLKAIKAVALRRHKALKKKLGVSDDSEVGSVTTSVTGSTAMDKPQVDDEAGPQQGRSWGSHEVTGSSLVLPPKSRPSEILAPPPRPAAATMAGPAQDTTNATKAMPAPSQDTNATKAMPALSQTTSATKALPGDAAGEFAFMPAENNTYNIEKRPLEKPELILRAHPSKVADEENGNQLEQPTTSPKLAAGNKSFTMPANQQKGNTMKESTIGGIDMDQLLSQQASPGRKPAPPPPKAGEIDLTIAPVQSSKQKQQQQKSPLAQSETKKPKETAPAPTSASRKVQGLSDSTIGNIDQLLKQQSPVPRTTARVKTEEIQFSPKLNVTARCNAQGPEVMSQTSTEPIEHVTHHHHDSKQSTQKEHSFDFGHLLNQEEDVQPGGQVEEKSDKQQYPETRPEERQLRKRMQKISRRLPNELSILNISAEDLSRCPSSILSGGSSSRLNSAAYGGKYSASTLESTAINAVQHSFAEFSIGSDEQKQLAAFSARQDATLAAVMVHDMELADSYGDLGVYSGATVNDLPHGEGCMKYENGREYKGEWNYGRWHGKGRLRNQNGDSYEGDYVFDSRHGKGVYRWHGGNLYEGEFHQDSRHGQGTFTFSNGNVYQGEFSNGSFEGHGTYVFEGGRFEGSWKSGRYDGFGKLDYADGTTYVGEFESGVAHGEGEEIDAYGNVRKGIWRNGELA